MFTQPLVQQLSLVGVHDRGPTPIRPSRLVLLVVVVSGVHIGNGVDETQDKSFGSPVDHDVHSHVILVQGNLFHARKCRGSAAETQFPTNARKARKPHPEKQSGVSGSLRSAKGIIGAVPEERHSPRYAPMESPAFQYASQILFGGILFIWVDEIYEGLADEELSLFSKVALQHRIEVQKVEVRGQECPVYRGKEVKDGE